MIWNTILDRVKSSFNKEAPGNRQTSLFSNTVKYHDTASRKDKSSQESIQNDIDSGKKVSISNPQSSRWQISKEDQKQRGLTKNDTLYTADDIADMQVDAKKETSVASSAIDKINYNPKTGDLDIKYKSGKKEYRFPKVPAEVVKEFLDSPSKGKYLAYIIKPRYSINWHK